MFHGKMDSPAMPFSIARSAVFRHGRATAMYYSEMEDDNQCSIRKIEAANLKISKVADFIFDENDQWGKHDVCRCISTSVLAKDETACLKDGRDIVAKSVQAQDASIAYFSNPHDLCEYIKTISFSGVVQHVSADCGPDICETRYRMLKTSWYRQTISTEMKINRHRASSEQPVHEIFCTFDGPMHLVETYSTCSKSLNAKIAAFIRNITNVVNAYIPLSSEIWNGEFYLNHSRAGILRFEFASFVQIVSRQHFLSLESVDQLIPKTNPSKSTPGFSAQTSANSREVAANFMPCHSSRFQTIRPQSASSISTLSHHIAREGLQMRTDAPKSQKLLSKRPVYTDSSQPLGSKLSFESLDTSLDAMLDKDATLEEGTPTITSINAFSKFREGKQHSLNRISMNIDILCELLIPRTQRNANCHCIPESTGAFQAWLRLTLCKHEMNLQVSISCSR